MNPNKSMFLGISILILSISIFISSIIISNSFKQLNNSPITKEDSVHKNENILSLEEAADYLGTSAENLKYIIEKGAPGLTFTRLEGKYIFSKKAIDKWLENTTWRQP